MNTVLKLINSFAKKGCCAVSADEAEDLSSHSNVTMLKLPKAKTEVRVKVYLKLRVLSDSCIRTLRVPSGIEQLVQMVDNEWTSHHTFCPRHSQIILTPVCFFFSISFNSYWYVSAAVQHPSHLPPPPLFTLSPLCLFSFSVSRACPSLPTTYLIFLPYFIFSPLGRIQRRAGTSDMHRGSWVTLPPCLSVLS